MKSFAILSATAVSLVFAPDTALAQSCTEDADCAPEDYCDLYPSSGDSSGSSGDPDPGCAPGEDCGGGAPPSDGEPSDAEPSDGEADEDPAPVTEQPAAGQCERGGRECTSDDECLEDHYCAFDEFETAVGCAPGTECEPTTTQGRSSTGRCEHNPYTCSTDADCPNPAVCGEDGECLYVLEPCETNDECSTLYECLPLRGSSTDSSSSEDSGDPGAAAPKDSADVAGDPLPDPAAPPNSGAESVDDTEASEAAAAAQEAEDARAEEVEATEDVPSEDAAGICFPELVECETDADCMDDWVCAAIDDGPPSWEDVEYACLPPGIAAVLDGDLEVEGGGRGESEDSGALGSDGEMTPIEDSDEDDIELGTQGGSEGSAPGDSCSVAIAGGHPRGATWAWLVGVVALLGARSFRHRGSPWASGRK